MKINQELERVAFALVKIAEESDYKYDPEHKHKPEGGGWERTQGGWSKGTHKKEMSTTQKIPAIPLKPTPPNKPQESTKPDAPETKPPVVRKQETLWPQALPSENLSKSSPHKKFLNSPEVRRMRKDITINPNRLVENMFKDKNYVKEEYKPMLAKVYRTWLDENKSAEGEDAAKNVEAVKTALKMIEPPKFKKMQPKLTPSMQNLLHDNNVGEELAELTGFKDKIKNNPQMSDKEYKRRIEQGIRLPRNQQQLKNAFVNHMNPQNYDSMDAFNAAKKRVQAMSVSDFGKLLGSLFAEDEEAQV